MLSTSCSLDFETDEKMRQVVRTELADCTVLAVAHRIGEEARTQFRNIDQ